MAELLSEGRLVRLDAVDAITAAAFLPRVVVFGRYLGVVRGFEKRAEPERGSVEQWRFRIAIPIAVVSTTVALYAKEEQPHLVVTAHHAGIHVGSDVGGTAIVDHRGVREIEEIAGGLFGNDIHHARNRISPEDGTASASNDLNAIHHPGGHLLQPIYARQRAEDRTRVHQNLRILAF